MKYREIKNYKYELMEELVIFVSELPNIVEHNFNRYVYIEDRMLRLSKHYAWDGSTIPMKKVFRFIGWNSDKFCKKASVVHDALYQLMRAGLLDKEYKDFADGLYKKMCIEGGMSSWQANLRYWALKKFGSLKYQDMTPKIIEVL